MEARAVRLLCGSSRWRPSRAHGPLLTQGFGITPGALVVVCGLHGGAGTTTVTVACAVAAAGVSPQGSVLVAEADPRAGELAARLGVASTWTLDALAEFTSAGRRPDAPFAERADGLRVIASEVSPVGRATDIAPVLAEARRVHGLVVVDAGALNGPVASTCLCTADVVVWTARAERLELAAQRLSGPPARRAHGGRWMLAVTGGRGARGDLACIRDDLAARIALPADLERRPEAAQALLAAVRALVP